MKPVMVVKAYLPTIDEARGVSLDDIQALRWIPERHRKTFAQPVSVSRSRKEGVGQTVPWEIDVAQKEHGVPLPGLLSEDKTGIDPRRDVTGTWVGPSNLGTLLEPDFTFDPRRERGILLGTTETPHWWRTMLQGAKSQAGEGFQYGGFPKESFVEIPRPLNANPLQLAGGAYNIVTGVSEPTPEIADFLGQFPQEQGTHRWGQTMGAPITEQQLIDQGLITPLSYEQRIVDSPFLPRKVASEPMNIAFQLLKEDIDYQDEDYIHPHEQIWNDEADEQLLDTTNSLWNYVQNMSNDDKMEWLRLQGNPFMQRGMQRMYGDYPELSQQEIDDSIWEMLFDAWQDSQAEMPGGIDFGDTKPDGLLDPVRAHAVHPSQWKKLASEPMDIAFQLLKERVSPEAKRHKLEYDKKYESSPERVKYREELNRERRRRGIYGSHDHKDISHTEGGKLTLEGEHENRARHFKDKGTLREL
jgi:hypothetical protein